MTVENIHLLFPRLTPFFEISKTERNQSEGEKTKGMTTEETGRFVYAAII